MVYHTMVYHGVPWYTMVHRYDIEWFTMVNHGKPWYNSSVTNETFVAELFLTNGVSVNLFGVRRQLSVSASTCRNSRKSLPPRCGL